MSQPLDAPMRLLSRGHSQDEGEGLSTCHLITQCVRCQDKES